MISIFKRVPATLALLALMTSVSTAQAATPTATLTVNSATSQVQVGQNITTNVLLNTGGQAVSAVDILVKFSPNLEYVTSSSTDTVFSTEVTPAAASGNSVHFAKLRTDTGYTGTNGKIISLTFKALTSGNATVSINKDSSIVGAYSDSTNILSSVTNGSYTVGQASTTSDTTDVTQLPVTGTSPYLLLLIVLTMIVSGSYYFVSRFRRK